MNLNETLSRSTEQLSTPEAQGFDYGSLNSETRIVVQKRTSEIKSLMRRTAQDILDIGQKLTEVKQQLGHGNFEAWLKAEFEWSEWTARKFIQVARQFKTVNFTDLSVAASALYVLASSSTPENAWEEALERAIKGEAICYTEAKDIVTRHKEAAKSKASKAVTVDLPVETVVRDSSSPSEPHLVSQTLESQSAASIKKAKYKLHEKETEALAHFQLRNLSHDMAPDTGSGDYSLKNQSKIDIQSLSLIGHLIYITDQEQQESKLLGQISEIKEVTNSDVVIRISLQSITD